MRLLQNMREVFRTLKHQRPTKIYCPRCESPEIHLFSDLAAWLAPRKYVCKNCGYTGPIVMELDKKERL